MNATPLPDDPPLAAALRASPTAATCGSRCGTPYRPRIPAAVRTSATAVDIGTSITDGISARAAIDWLASITDLDTRRFPGSGGEQRVLRLAATESPSAMRDARSPEWIRPESALRYAYAELSRITHRPRNAEETLATVVPSTIKPTPGVILSSLVVRLRSRTVSAAVAPLQDPALSATERQPSLTYIRSSMRRTRSTIT